MPGSTQPIPAGLLGVSRQSIDLTKESTVEVVVDNEKLRSLLTASAAGKLYVSLEQLRSTHEGTTLELYLRLDAQNVLLTSEGLYGIKKASNNAEAQGLTLVAEIPAQVVALLPGPALTAKSVLQFYITTRFPLPAEATLMLGRVTLHYTTE